MRRFAEAAGFTTHRALVLDFGVGKRQDTVRTSLLGLLGLTETSPMEVRRQAADELLVKSVVDRGKLALLGELLEFPETGEWRALCDG